MHEDEIFGLLHEGHLENTFKISLYRLCKAWQMAHDVDNLAKFAGQL